RSPDLSYSLPFIPNNIITTTINTLSLHDALPISGHQLGAALYEHLNYNADGQLLASNFMYYWAPTAADLPDFLVEYLETPSMATDRKSTRLNSSHEWISYAVFCLKKKRKLIYPSQ